MVSLPEVVRGYFSEAGGTGRAIIIRVGDDTVETNTPTKAFIEMKLLLVGRLCSQQRVVGLGQENMLLKM